MPEENGCDEAAWVADKAYRFRAAAFLIIGRRNGSRHSRRMPISPWTRGKRQTSGTAAGSAAL